MDRGGKRAMQDKYAVHRSAERFSFPRPFKRKLGELL